MLPEIPHSELAPLEQQRGGLVARATAIVISSPESNEAAGAFLLDAKRLRKTIDDKLDPLVKRAYDTHRGLTAFKREFTDPLDAAERAVKGKIAAWTDAERKRREAEARAEAERLRKEAEDARLAQALELEQAGHAEQAEALIEAPVRVAPPPPAKVEQASGVSTRQVWKFDIFDASRLPREYMLPNESAIRKVVQALEGAASIPGVRVYSETMVVGRA